MWLLASYLLEIDPVDESNPQFKILTNIVSEKLFSTMADYKISYNQIDYISYNFLTILSGILKYVSVRLSSNIVP